MSQIILTRQVELELQTCITCGCQFALPSSLDSKLRENHESFYCPNGHKQFYTAKSEAEKLREELRRKEQELANRVQEGLTLKEALNKTNRKLKRLNNGVCSCCNRTFTNLAEHIKSQHPELIGKEKTKRKTNKTT